jgi:hypothetical protein
VKQISLIAVLLGIHYLSMLTLVLSANVSKQRHIAVRSVAYKSFTTGSMAKGTDKIYLSKNLLLNIYNQFCWATSTRIKQLTLPATSTDYAGKILFDGKILASIKLQ